MVSRKQSVSQKFVSIAQAAEYTGLSAGTIRSLIARRELAVYRPVPGRVMLDLEDVDRFVRRTRDGMSTRGRRKPEVDDKAIEPDGAIESETGDGINE